MNLKNLAFIAAFSVLTGLFSCKTDEKKEGTENPSVLNNDLSNAKEINFIFPLKDSTILVDSGNTGGGQVQEFNADSASLRHMLASEDNTDWYKLTASGDTAISFTIKPKDAAAELDFVLFRVSSQDISGSLAAGVANALRSNFNKASGDGSTGLACDPSLSFHGTDGNSMSRAFTIRKDQTYYLVVNSTSGKSSGYEISFHACAPGEGGLSDFEGNAENPEADPAAGTVGSGAEGQSEGAGTSSESGDAASGESASAGKGGASGSGKGSATAGNASGGKSGAGKAGAAGSGKDAAGTGNASGGKSGAGKAGAAGSGKDAAGTGNASGGKAGAGKAGAAGSGKDAAGTGNASGGKSGAGKAGAAGSGKDAAGTGNVSGGKAGAGKAGAAGSNKTLGKNETVSDYEVGSQETLYSIAFKMGMTVEELMALNGLTDTNIFPGQKLKVVKRDLSQKAIEEKMAKSKLIKPSPPKPGSTTDPKEIARLKAEKAAAEEARKKAIAEELKAKAAAANAGKAGADGKDAAGNNAEKSGGQGGNVDALTPKTGTETLSGRNPNFNPTPNFPVNNPKVNKGVETSNSLAPADKSFYVYCNVTSGVNRNPVAGVLQVVDLKKKDLVYNVQANRTQAVPLFNAGGKQKLMICDIFGYKKQDFDLNLDNIINDSTAQQVQIVDDTIVINFELRRLEKGDVAVAYNIFFYDDASVMLPKSTYELDQLLELMQENKKIKVKIHGHTNTSKLGKILYLDKGDKNFFRLTAKNKEIFGPAKMLSKKRAETIKMYLESKRITDDRIETEGHGGSQMLYPNTHPLAFKNKRVEVEILEDK